MSLIAPLNEAEVLCILDIIEQEQRIHPLDILDRFDEDRGTQQHIRDQLYLEYMEGAEKGGAFYLYQQGTVEQRLDLRYVVTINGIVTFSRDRFFKAAWLADKLCQLLFTAKEIRVYDNVTGKDIIKWTRLAYVINGWIGGRQ